MIWLKGCPKCRGDMHFDPLMEEYVCLQCGLAVDRPPPPRAGPPSGPTPARVTPGEPPLLGRKSR